MGGSARIGRLRWMCRRGMKELDVLLERFISEAEPQLREGKWPEFETLLQHEDDVLWDELRGAGQGIDDSLSELITAIRHGSRAGS